jgi:hypothetical protein
MTVIDPSIEAQINKLFADLRCEIDAQREADIKHVLTAVSEVAGQVFVEHSNKLGNNLSNKLLEHAEKLVRDTRNELFALVDKRFAELQERLDGFLPDRDPTVPRRKVLDS